MMALMGLRYLLLFLLLPAYCIALTGRRWTTVPVWLVSSAVLLTQFLISAQQRTVFDGGINEYGFVYVGEMTKIMLIPIIVQSVVVFRRMAAGIGSQAAMSPRKLLEAVAIGKR
jgi:hypothetical protein